MAPLFPQAKARSVDVVIPVYNGAPHILSAIESVDRQDLPAKTIIVVDDGSTDATPDIIRHYHGVTPLRYLRQENRGLSAARNTGWRAGHSEFVAFLDADDVWEPQKLSAQMGIWDHSMNQKVDLVYCGYHSIDQAGQTVTIPGRPIIPPQLRGRVFEALLPKNIVSGSGSAVVIRRAALHVTGGFDESLRALEDWDLWLRIAQQSEIDFVDRDLVGIRTHSGGMQQDQSRMMTATIDFFSRWLERLPDKTQPPSGWVKTLVRYAGNSWPPNKFWRTLNTRMSPTARQRLADFIRRDMKAYAAVRFASLPIELLIRRPWRQQRS
ncbi:MAG: glycosyltransferase family 2 protein [Candidatus Kerfeldbacteria bacterium]|nr:glycosyltransferase family 2 protein [Candidatus Kerfeldbacteria bacterium]